MGLLGVDAALALGFDGNSEVGTVGAAVCLGVFCFVLGESFILFLFFFDLFWDLDCFLLS